MTTKWMPKGNIKRNNKRRWEKKRCNVISKLYFFMYFEVAFVVANILNFNGWSTTIQDKHKTLLIHFIVGIDSERQIQSKFNRNNFEEKHTKNPYLVIHITIVIAVLWNKTVQTVSGLARYGIFCKQELVAKNHLCRFNSQPNNSNSNYML